MNLLTVKLLFPASVSASAIELSNLCEGLRFDVQQGVSSFHVIISRYFPADDNEETFLDWIADMRREFSMLQWELLSFQK